MPLAAAVTLFLLAQAAQPASRPAATDPTARGFLYKTLDFEGATYPYCVFVPPGYTPDKPWPAILFLCGSGETGNDGFKQTDVGLGKLLRNNHARVPAIVVFPQCPARTRWIGRNALMALRCLEEVSREYNLDTDRLYLTGLSLGGQGSWYIGQHFGQNFAAIVPICGFLDNIDRETSAEGLAALAASPLKDVPIWCTHGAVDRNVPPERTREIVAALRAAGANVHYVEYPDLAHNCWDKTYEDPALWRWLFSQRRGGPASRPAGP